jgi:hypothetical protein
MTRLMDRPWLLLGLVTLGVAVALTHGRIW